MTVILFALSLFSLNPSYPTHLFFFVCYICVIYLSFPTPFFSLAIYFLSFSLRVQNVAFL